MRNYFYTAMLFIAATLSFSFAQANAAQAAGVYIVQLGNYASPAEAEARWGLLNSSYESSFAKLGHQAVPLEGSNGYRLQAGPFASDGQARSLCQQVSTTGQPCSVAETAMFTADAPQTAEQPAIVAATSGEPSIPATALAANAAFAQSESAQSGNAANPLGDLPPEVLMERAPAAPEAVAPSTPEAAVPAASLVAPAAPLSPVSISDNAPAPMPSVSRPAPAERSAAPAIIPAAPPVSGQVSAGQVKVAEAVQVPLSNASTARPMVTPTGRPLALNSNHALGWGAMPSANPREQALWVQLSYFANDATAMGYFNNLRQQYPQLAQMRGRIVRPYMQQTGKQLTSLRMGPFLTTRDVQSICAASARFQLRCTAVRDLGNSGSAVMDRSVPYSAYRNLSTPQALGYRSNGMQSYMVQLGSYATRDAAGRSWQALRSSHRPILASMQPTIIEPRGSNMVSAYRLQTGPFATRLAAEQRCDSLRSTGVNCLVVSAQ